MIIFRNLFLNNKMDDSNFPTLSARFTYKIFFFSPYCRNEKTLTLSIFFSSMALNSAAHYLIQIHSLKKKYLIDLSHLFSSMALINEIMNTPLLFIINTCVVLLWVFAASIMSSLLQSCNQHFRGFTYPLVFDCWIT